MRHAAAPTRAAAGAAREPLAAPDRRLHWLAVAAGLALVLTACPEQQEEAAEAPDTPAVDGDDPVSTEPPDTGPVADVPDLVREVAPSTVSVEITLTEGIEGDALGAASGVVWAADGYIVTNAHVAEPADELVVVLADGTRHDAEVVATDIRTDLAVLAVDVDGLPTVPFADALPELGELAVAIGNPLGFQNTVTVGVVSGLDRSLPPTQDGLVLAGLIQTDAAISSGSSGGALIDGHGRVIGINVAAADAPEGMGVVEGIGFAIPATTVVPTVEQLIETGEVAHAFLGIQGATLTPQLAERFGLDRTRGVLAGQVQPGSPADEGGLARRDVLIALDGSDLEQLGDLLFALQQQDPGDTVTVTIVRDGEEQDVEVTLAEVPDP